MNVWLVSCEIKKFYKNSRIQKEKNSSLLQKLPQTESTVTVKVNTKERQFYLTVHSTQIIYCLMVLNI